MTIQEALEIRNKADEEYCEAIAELSLAFDKRDKARNAFEIANKVLMELVGTSNKNQ